MQWIGRDLSKDYFLSVYVTAHAKSLAGIPPSISFSIKDHAYEISVQLIAIYGLPDWLNTRGTRGTAEKGNKRYTGRISSKDVSEQRVGGCLPFW